MELKKIAGAFFLLSFCLFRAPGLFAQKLFTIEYRYAAADIPGDSVYFQLLRPADRSIAVVKLEDKGYPMKAFRFFREGDSAVCICTFEVADTSCAIVLDGFGHESFIIPGDTARISFAKPSKPDGKSGPGKDLMIMWFHNFVYSGKNRYIYALFDSLTYHADDLRFSSVGLQKTDLDLNKFFRLVTEVYRDRMEYTDHYCTYYHIPANIRRLAVAEIRSAYVINLARPMSNIVKTYELKDYSREYLDNLAVFDHPDNENIGFTGGELQVRFCVSFRYRGDTPLSYF